MRVCVCEVSFSFMINFGTRQTTGRSLIFVGDNAEISKMFVDLMS